MTVAQEGAYTVDRRDYNAAGGVPFSIERVCTGIREDSTKPKVRAWAAEVLIAAGKPATIAAQAQAILNAVRRHTIYAPDPVGTEMIVATEATMCLEPGKCIKAADCDDLTRCTGAGFMAVGIPVKILVQSWPGAQDHVLVMFQDEAGEWLAADPSTTLPVGRRTPSSQEQWFDPMDTTPSNHVGTASAPQYIGVGKPGFGAPADGILASFGQDLAERVSTTVFTLRNSLIRLKAANLALLNVRTAIRGAGNEFDLEPVNPPQSFEQFPLGPGVWTPTMQSMHDSLAQLTDGLVRIGNEALSGVRKTVLDSAGGVSDVFFERAAGDGSVPAIVPIVLAGVPVVGFVAVTGAAVSMLAQSVGPLAPQPPAGPAGLGNPVLIAGVVTAGVVITSILAYFAVAKLCDAVSAYEEATTQREIMRSVMSCVNEGKCTPEQAAGIVKASSDARVAVEQAKRETAKNDPFAGLADKTLATVQIVAVAAGVGILGYAGYKVWQGMRKAA